MTAEHASLRTRLGRVGAWTFTFDGRAPGMIAADVAAIEGMGFPALWMPEGGGSNDILTNLGWSLASSDRLTVASGIANISAREPEVLARGAAFLGEAHDDRLVLGIGVGHEYTTIRRGMDWDRPLERMQRYLDVMDAEDLARPAPRILAALGDGMLRIAATRALGAHSYFVPVSHTERARSVLGPEPVLAVELGVMPGADATTARGWGRAWAESYLELPNYAKNWRRLGYDEDDVAGQGSDRLLDAAFVWGGSEAIAARVREHLDAGADHVCVQGIGTPEGDADADLRCLGELAPALLAL